MDEDKRMQEEQDIAQQGLSTSEPWVSFCMSTFRRADLLRQALSSIRQQHFRDFEVIISDNDPDGSAEPVVKELQDSRFKYFHNGDNLGMIRSFNKCIERSCGKFIVFVTDDDPMYPEMLQTLYNLSLQYPDYGAYFGGHNTYFETLVEARVAKVRIGMVSALADTDIGAITAFSAEEFPLKFLQTDLSTQLNLSEGIVRREIALEVGGLADYGTPPMADLSYVLLSGSRAGLVYINTPLGHRTIHNENYSHSKANYDSIYKAPEGFYKWTMDRLPAERKDAQLNKAMQHYVGRDLTVQVIFIKRVLNYNQQKSPAFEEFVGRFFKIPLLRKWRRKYYISTHFPRCFEFFLALRKLLSPQPKK